MYINKDSNAGKRVKRVFTQLPPASRGCWGICNRRRPTVRPFVRTKLKNATRPPPSSRKRWTKLKTSCYRRRPPGIRPQNVSVRSSTIARRFPCCPRIRVRLDKKILLCFCTLFFCLSPFPPPIELKIEHEKSGTTESASSSSASCGLATCLARLACARLHAVDARVAGGGSSVADEHRTTRPLPEPITEAVAYAGDAGKARPAIDASTRASIMSRRARRRTRPTNGRRWRRTSSRRAGTCRELKRKRGRMRCWKRTTTGRDAFLCWIRDFYQNSLIAVATPLARECCLEIRQSRRMVRPVSRPREIFWPGGVLQRRKAMKNTFTRTLANTARYREVESAKNIR